MGSYLTRHLQVLFATLGDMRRTPMASFNTLVIIAIMILLPCMMYVFVKSAQSLSGTWQGRPQITIFLQKDLSQDVAKLIFEEIRLNPAIELAELISPTQALDEFKLLSKLDENAVTIDAQLELIGENPLPASIVVMPSLGFSRSDKLQNLKTELSNFEGIDTIQLDLDWIDRFNAILNVAGRIALLLSALLAIALIFIVGNTIKLLIMNRRHEIEITKLVGGTDTFVRRPFLYYGALFGFFGALIALGLLLLAAKLTQPAIEQLAASYQTGNLVYSPSESEIAIVIAISTGLGWLAARWSVAQHLRHIQPK